MNDFTNIAEYAVTKQRSRLFNVMKYAVPILFCVFPIIAALIFGGFGYITSPIVLVEISIVSTIYSAYYFRRIDYDYRMVGSELYFSVIYNRKKRKELGSVDVSKLEKIAPYTGKYYDEALSGSYTKVYDFSSAPDAPDVFYGVEKDDESGEMTMYIFNASDKMLKLIRTYNRRAIINYPNE